MKILKLKSSLQYGITVNQEIKNTLILHKKWSLHLNYIGEPFLFPTKSQFSISVYNQTSVELKPLEYMIVQT